MYAEIVRPDMRGHAQLDIPSGTRYIMVSETFPDVEITALGQQSTLLYCPAGGQAVVGIQGDIAGYDLPTSLDLFWAGADVMRLPGPAFQAAAVTNGGIDPNYGAVVYWSKQPIRLEGSGAVLRGSTVLPYRPADGDLRTVATVARASSLGQAGLLVAAETPLKPTYHMRIASPTRALAVSTDEAFSGIAATTSEIPTETTVKLTSCLVSLRSYPAPGAVLTLVLYRIAMPPFIFPLGSSAREPLTYLDDLEIRPPATSVREILRPDVPPYTGVEPLLATRMVGSAGGAGQSIELCPPEGIWLRAGYPAIGIAIRSDVAGSLAIYTSWTWQEGPAAWLD